MAVWRFVAANRDGTVLGDLVDAKSRTVTWSLAEPAVASFSLSGRSEQAETLREHIVDLIVYRDGDRLFRGRVGATGDDIDPDTHDMTVSVVDYRGLLERRIIWPGSTFEFTGVDVSEIAWTFIDDAQGVTGGDMGITRGTGQTTGVVKDIVYDIGHGVGDAINQLSLEAPGFDWEIDDGLVFNLYYPQRGSLREFGLSFDEGTGGNVTHVSRSVDPGEYSNAIRMSGDETLLPEIREVPDLLTRPEGRWERQIGFTDIALQTMLADRADQELETQSEIVPSYTMTLSPEADWSPAGFWIGDTGPVRINSGRLTVSSTLRLHQASIGVGDNGEETVGLTFGAAPRTTVKRLRKFASRIDNLERR